MMLVTFRKSADIPAPYYSPTLHHHIKAPHQSTTLLHDTTVLHLTKIPHNCTDSADLPNWSKYLGYLKKRALIGCPLSMLQLVIVTSAVLSKHTHLEKIHCDIKPYKMTL